jgi:hypothetical protein
MSPGDVLRWNEFELQRGPGPDKARWFIVLGQTGVFIVPTIIFSVTPTTQLTQFTPGSPREGRRVVRFSATPASPFSQDCLVDVEYDRYDLSTDTMEASKADIEIVGRISKEKILEIWRIVESSSRYSTMVKKDIKHCLVKAGIIRG